jgi:hypothetical protein
MTRFVFVGVLLLACVSFLYADTLVTSITNSSTWGTNALNVYNNTYTGSNEAGMPFETGTTDWTLTQVDTVMYQHTSGLLNVDLYAADSSWYPENSSLGSFTISPSTPLGSSYSVVSFMPDNASKSIDLTANTKYVFVLSGPNTGAGDYYWLAHDSYYGDMPSSTGSGTLPSFSEQNMYSTGYPPFIPPYSTGWLGGPGGSPEVQLYGAIDGYADTGASTPELPANALLGITMLPLGLVWLRRRKA